MLFHAEPLEVVVDSNSLIRFRSLLAFGGALLVGCSAGGGKDAPTGPAQPAAVARIEMSPPSVVFDVGANSTITATPKDASGTAVAGKVVRWLTSDGSIVDGSVDGNTAIIQGVSAGNANVTADVDGITGTVTVQVKVTAPQPVASIVITPSIAVLFVGETVPMLATLRDAAGNTLGNRAVAWSTSNSSIVNGSSSGNVASITGLAAGTVTISAASEGKFGTATVGVTSGSSGGNALTCANIAGGQIYAEDGQYLGLLANSINSESILNTIGRYGSSTNSTSMYNNVSRYGSSVGSLSAFNTIASTPPRLYKNGRFLAYVTKNTIKTPGIDPAALRTCNFP